MKTLPCTTVMGEAAWIYHTPEISQYHSQLTPLTCEHAKNRRSQCKSSHITLEKVIHTTKHCSTVNNGVDPSSSGIILPKVCLKLHKKNGDAPRTENMNTSLLNMEYLRCGKHCCHSSGIKITLLKILSIAWENQNCGCKHYNITCFLLGYLLLEFLWLKSILN